MTIERDQVEILVVKFSFLVQEQGEGILSMAGQFFANANVAIGGDTFTLEMMYPEGLGNGQIVNSSCGVHLTYIYRHILTSVMSNPLVSVNINGVASHNWSLVDFELLSGCGAFMLSTPA